MPFIRRGIMDTLSGYSEEALRALQKSALDEGKADEAARYGRELESRSGGLDMSQEARMARASEQGFDTNQTWYHGTSGNEGIVGFERSRMGTGTDEGFMGRGVYTSSGPDIASSYAEFGRGQGAVYPLISRGNYLLLEERQEDVGDMFARTRRAKEELGLPAEADAQDITDAAMAKGYDGIEFAFAGSQETPGGVRERVTFDPENIRSVNAKFDPATTTNNILGRATPGGMAAAGAAAGAAALASQEAEAAPMGTLADGIKMATRQAYHGSPHDFDKFSLAKIGTGEGAQAYGHGLYFSSKEDIARFYRDKLSGMVDKYGSPDLSRRVTKVGDAKAADLGQDVWEIADQLAARNISIDDYISSLKAKRAASQNSAQIKVMDDLIGQAEDAAPSLRGKEVRFEYPGKLYTVEIPDESYMLDWDKPLSDELLEIIEKDDVLNEAFEDAEYRTRILATTLDYEMKGRSFYDALADKLGGRQEASERLRQAGIPGITYKGTTSGERNFVIFDDEMINLIQKGMVDPKLLPALAVGGATVGYATSEFAAAESSLNATESDMRASAERFKALRKGKRAQTLSNELQRVIEPVAGPAKALMDATEVMLVGIAGGIPGYLSELTGYVRGQDLDEAKAGGEALAGKLTGTMAEALGEDWDPQNPYLQGLAKAMEQGEKEFQDAYRMLGVENSVMKKGWDQLPERAQRIIKGMADLAL